MVDQGRVVTRVAVTVRTKTFFTRTKIRKLRVGGHRPESHHETALEVLDQFELDRPVRLLGVRLELAPPARRRYLSHTRAIRSPCCRRSPSADTARCVRWCCRSGLTVVRRQRHGKSSLYRGLLADWARRGDRSLPARRPESCVGGPEHLGARRTGGSRHDPPVRSLGFASDDFGYWSTWPDGGIVVRPRPEIKRGGVRGGVASRRWWPPRLRRSEAESGRLRRFPSCPPTAGADAHRRPTRRVRTVRTWRSTTAPGGRRAIRLPGGTRTPVLSDDGAIWRRVRRYRSRLRRPSARAEAFDGATVSVAVHDGLFDLQLQQKGMLRPLRAAELSDGTLRFLLWAARF